MTPAERQLLIVIGKAVLSRILDYRIYSELFKAIEAVQKEIPSC